MKKGRETVFVGLSGGVDSSVAALLLKRAGYSVVGVFIRAWRPEFVICDEAEERVDAMRVAAHLEIPFYTLDAREEYRREVVEKMIEEYRSGRTPNPDMLCNRAVKFGVFEEFRKRQGVDFLATGHYARICMQDGIPYLRSGVDATKDQSYFLAQIPKEVLPHVLFPIGDYTKVQIRALAKGAGLPSAKKKDSQGVCFLGKVDMTDFLSHYMPQTTGVVRDHAQNVIGEHDGALFYTIGQRHGLRITTSNDTTTPHYVVAKNILKNELIVSATHPTTPPGSAYTLGSMNLFVRIGLDPTRTYTVVTRYHGAPNSAIITSDGKRLICTLSTLGEAVSPGQSCVIYDGDVVVGSGIIESHEYDTRH